MAKQEDEVRSGAEQESEETQPAGPQSAGLAARFLTAKWLLILLAVSVVGHGITFTYLKLTAEPSVGESTSEYSLGPFRFAADPSEGGPVSSAEFSLHITLLREVDGSARLELWAKKFRVQQAVEELIRRAHGGDFDDPLLGDLKRQLQEQINQTLGIRAIDDVIITDLQLVRNPNATDKITETAGALPWTEEPAG